MHAVAAWLLYQLAPFCGRHMQKVLVLRFLQRLCPRCLRMTQGKKFRWLQLTRARPSRPYDVSQSGFLSQLAAVAGVDARSAMRSGAPFLLLEGPLTADVS